MFYKMVDKDKFYSTVNTIKYRTNDIREAYEFGASSIKVCYDKAKHKFARYCIVYEDDNRPIVTIMLQRDGNMVFFISKDVSSPIALIRLLNNLASDTAKNSGAIFTRTANWYKEALRLNKLTGFKLYQKYDGYNLYVRE